MQEILQFFEGLTNGEKFLWVFICLGFTWILEAVGPLVNLQYKKWKHASVNLIFLGTSMLINALFGLATVGVFLWTSQNNFGLLNWINLPVWAELLIAMMILDFFAQYVAHYMLHRYKWMWRFHMVHHSDLKVDATTGTRHHPGDYLIREIYALFAIFIAGIPISYYVMYRIITVFCTYITHANITVPTWLDKPLSYVFITPNIHKFHHHFERPWTDSNFGNIFSFWDRMFGTLVYDDPKKVVYGLDVLDGSTDEDIAYQFKIPFDKTIKTSY